MLKLPDGRTLSRDAAIAAVDDYAQNWPCVFELYDLPSGGAHDDLLPVDLLALNALNAWGGGQPMTAMTAAWVEREKIGAAVRSISSEPLEKIDESRLDAESERIAAAIEVVDAIRGY